MLFLTPNYHLSCKKKPQVTSFSLLRQQDLRAKMLPFKKAEKGFFLVWFPLVVFLVKAEPYDVGGKTHNCHFFHPHTSVCFYSLSNK